MDVLLACWVMYLVPCSLIPLCSYVLINCLVLYFTLPQSQSLSAWVWDCRRRQNTWHYRNFQCKIFRKTVRVLRIITKNSLLWNVTDKWCVPGMLLYVHQVIQLNGAPYTCMTHCKTLSHFNSSWTNQSKHLQKSQKLFVLLSNVAPKVGQKQNLSSVYWQILFDLHPL